MELIPVILSGGSGTRLWPVSRSMQPKPFMRLADGTSLIEQTFQRAARLPNVNTLVTVTNRDYYFQTLDAYRQCASTLSDCHWCLEPCARNSAAAIGLASLYIRQRFGDQAIALVLSADHLIEDEAAFAQAIEQAKALAAQGQLVTFGAKPHCAHTGYGYIRAQGDQVAAFVEKPDAQRAGEFFASGDYWWNCGLFCFSPAVMLEAMTQYCPDIIQAVERSIQSAIWDHGIVGCDCSEQDYAQVPAAPIDTAVFEQADQVAMVACDMGWSDIGDWSEFGQRLPKDASGNHSMGEAYFHACADCIAYGQPGRLMAVCGLDDVMLVDTPDAVLVASRSHAQQVKQMVAQLRQDNHPAANECLQVHRPWGHYRELLADEQYKIKRIVVNPGGQLSLQSHQHRNEHWVIVSGVAQVTRGDRIQYLTANESIYIPAGMKHRLENFSNEVLVVIEVQCGSYLGEDDIVRYEDVYGRQAEAIADDALAIG